MVDRLLVIVCVLCVSPALGYQSFQDRIPNGNRVPHPCKPNELWEGVGHFNVGGGGNRNPFGQDFDEAGKEWTEALCRKDSDGDGKTNGQELGDPECTWRLGEVPKFTSGLSHPGVCEPLDSVMCQQRQYDVGLFRVQQEWMADACKRDEFVCEGLSDPDLKNVTFRFPKTSVPAEETTYMCAVFDFPEPDSDVHMIATTPLLDNRHVMHHAVLFACTGEVNDQAVGEPYVCGMSAHTNCSTILSIWTLGQNGECYHSNTGIRLGVNGYTKLALQFHWNNPELKTTYEDSSGMTLYYTPNRRTHDAGVWLLGNVEFEIPPRRELVEVKATCTAGCTRNYMEESVYVTAAWNHMHYLGVSQTIEHYRDGVKLRDITNDVTYSYDSPKTHEYSVPIEIKPGDELKTTCRYNSMTRTKTTAWGDSTQQEMCFGFLYYYPADALRDTSCNSLRSLAYCDKNATFNGCDDEAFWRGLGSLAAEIEANCVTYTCFQECKETILAQKARNPCMANKDYMTNFKKWFLSGKNDGFLAKLISCDAEIYAEEKKGEGKEGGNGGAVGSASAVTYSFVLILLALFLQ